ncbi:MAG TPA: hypothetical protein VK453_21650 [Micromonosporaceae bacterium]|nr:hypothetical protein [Micromonosporaceae bacterium]
MLAQDPYGSRSGQSAPDPASARTLSEFVACLRQLKLWAGDPSFEVLRRRCGVPSSTLADAVRPDRTRLPRLEVVRRFVHACGGTTSDVAAWDAGWREVRERLDAPLPRPRRPQHSRQRTGPHQLPRGLPHLVGRQAALDQLDTRHSERAGLDHPLLALIVGPAGVGKTALALHWGHRFARHHRGGQLYVDLAGVATRPDPDPGDALLHLLTALGVPPGEVPAELGSRIGLYRSLTYSRRLLIVLDDARDAEQVRPLLPGGPDCTTLVTSRNRLSGLVAGDDVVRLTLGPLPADDAVDVIASMLGPARVAAQLPAIRELARLCGHLPLALRIVAANLVDHPHWTVADYAARLASGDRLAQLSLVGDNGTAVRAAFDSSYAALPDLIRATFRSLASAPEPDFTVDDATAVVHRSPAQVRRHLDALVAAHLVEPTGPGRYAMAELLRLYASELAVAAGQGRSGAGLGAADR